MSWKIFFQSSVLQIIDPQQLLLVVALLWYWIDAALFLWHSKQMEQQDQMSLYCTTAGKCAVYTAALEQRAKCAVFWKALWEFFDWFFCARLPRWSRGWEKKDPKFHIKFDLSTYNTHQFVVFSHILLSLPHEILRTTVRQLVFTYLHTLSALDNLSTWHHFSDLCHSLRFTSSFKSEMWIHVY